MRWSSSWPARRGSASGRRSSMTRPPVSGSSASLRRSWPARGSSACRTSSGWPTSRTPRRGGGSPAARCNVMPGPQGGTLTQPAPIAVALDAPDLETAARWAGLVTPHVSTLKIGLELYLRYGPEVVASVRGASGVQIFLDLKLHDIPATVAAASRAVARLRPALLTVHAAAGSAAIRAAADAVPGTRVIAVTVLTSLGEADLQRIGLAGPANDAVRRLAALAVDAGARGLVCSPQEVAAV